MKYQIIPIGHIWSDGMVAIPKKIATDYIRMASDYQLKALLIILAQNGNADSKEIAKALGCTEADAVEFLEFWVSEGILSLDGKTTQLPKTVVEPKTKEVKKPKRETSSAPTLSPSEVRRAGANDKEVASAFQHAQEVLGRSLSHVELELIVNMITYYGLPCDVVLTILQYYKSEKSKGRAIGTAYIAAMAKNWSEEGIVTLDDAEEKLRSLEQSDRLWNEIVAVSGISHRNPTIKQREMIGRWAEDYGIDMIAIACDIMKENTDKPNLKYVDGIIKNWKKKGIFTPDDVAKQEEAHQSQKDQKGKASIDKTYDIDEINTRAMLNDDYDI